MFGSDGTILIHKISGMEIYSQKEPLSVAGLNGLGDLKSCKGGGAMNVEALDGFFAALSAGSETVMLSEYYQEIFRGETRSASPSSVRNRAVVCTK
jgi:hypothetical protein